MSDLIKRADVLDLLKKLAADHFEFSTRYEHYLEIGTEIEDAVKEMPSAEPQCSDCLSYQQWCNSLKEPQRWIPVMERLPIKEFEEGRRNRTVYDIYPCLVTRYSMHTDEPRTLTYVCKSYFDGDDFMLHGGYAPDERSDTENTLAWMPLPEPWKGGAE